MSLHHSNLNVTIEPLKFSPVGKPKIFKGTRWNLFYSKIVDPTLSLKKERKKKKGLAWTSVRSTVKILLVENTCKTKPSQT